MPGYFRDLSGRYCEGDRFLACEVPDKQVIGSRVICRVMNWQGSMLRLDTTEF